jgi:peptidyl-prolyl cis-trans isomerase A (cyclophilin A)
VTRFVIQGGGYLPITAGAAPVAKPTNPPIALEVGRGLSNVQWTLAMARTSVPNSATSQFFVNMVDNAASLDPRAGSEGYAVFGTLSAGRDVATAILGAPCAPLAGFSECVPNPNMVIVAALQTQ